jgi:hypothetical protein
MPVATTFELCERFATPKADPGGVDPWRDLAAALEPLSSALLHKAAEFR